jgi:hypothetical protein
MEQPHQLNTSNPDAIVYQTEELGFTVLGGIRLDGLDRLRVTLKIEVVNRKFVHYLNSPELAALAIRHNIDLYNDTQVEKLIRRTAERLETGISALTGAIAALTTQLELYRLEQVKQQNKQKEQQRKILNPEEREQAMAFLEAPNLMERTNEMLGKAGIIGEELNRLLMYLIFTSRKREHPLHVISLGGSGTGKTYLQEKTGELIPEEDKVEITTLSDNAFYYFERNELSHKLILIEDFDGAESVLYPLRELQSKKRIIKTVTFKDSRGQTKTVHLTVEGPVCVAGCTTKESIYEDNANRSFLVYLDESPEQDENIMNYQRKLSAGKVDTAAEKAVKELMQNCQRILRPITIRNTYAELLQIPKEVFKPRRTNAHYLAFIEAVTFYHQYQRPHQADEQTGELYIETTAEDVAEANKLMKHILLRKSDELTGACRNYFELLKAFLKQASQSAFTNKEIRVKMRIPLSTVKRHHFELLSCGYLKLSGDKKERGYRYEVVSYEEYQALQNQIITVLDEVLNKIITLQQPNGPISAQCQIEPINEQQVSTVQQQPKSLKKSISALKQKA